MPMERAPVFAIIATGLVAASAGSKGVWARVIIDWFPLFVVLYVYDRLRGVADTWLTPHIYPQLDFDRFLFGGIPTLQLQHALYTPGTAHIWDYLVFLTYMSHFIVPIGVAAVLWKVAHEKFRRYVFLFVTLTMAAFLTYLFYPAVPPWMASRNGLIAAVIQDHRRHVGPRGPQERRPDVLRDQSSRQPRRGGAVAAHRVPRTHHVVLLERRRASSLAAPALSARDVVHADLHRRALLLRHRARMALRVRGVLPRLRGVRPPTSARKTSIPSTVATRRQFPWARNREKAPTVAGG